MLYCSKYLSSGSLPIRLKDKGDALPFACALDSDSATYKAVPNCFSAGAPAVYVNPGAGHGPVSLPEAFGW